MNLSGGYELCEELGDGKSVQTNRANKALNLLKQRISEQSGGQVSLTAYADKSVVTNESIMRAIEPTLALKVVDKGSNMTIDQMMEMYNLDQEELKAMSFYGLPPALLQNAEFLVTLPPSESAGLKYEVCIGKPATRESRQASPADTSRFSIGCSVATRSNAHKPWVPSVLEAIFIYIPKPGVDNGGNLMDDCFNNTLTVFGLCFSGVQGGYHMAVLHGDPMLLTPNDHGYFGPGILPGANPFFVGKQCYIDNRAVPPTEPTSKVILGEIFKAVQHDLVLNKYEEVNKEKFKDDNFLTSYRVPILCGIAPIWLGQKNEVVQIPNCPTELIVPLIHPVVLALLLKYYPTPRALIYDAEEMSKINAVLTQHPSFWSSRPLKRTPASPAAGSALPNAGSARPGTDSSVELEPAIKEVLVELNSLYVAEGETTAPQKKMAVEIVRVKKDGEKKLGMERPMKFLKLLLVLAKEELTEFEQHVPWLTLSKLVGKHFNNSQPVKWDKIKACPQAVTEYLNGQGIPGLIEYIFMVASSEEGECANFKFEDAVTIIKWFVESAVHQNNKIPVVSLVEPDGQRPIQGMRAVHLSYRGGGGGGGGDGGGGGGSGSGGKRSVTAKDGNKKKKPKLSHEENIKFWLAEVEDFDFMTVAWNHDQEQKKEERIRLIEKKDDYDEDEHNLDIEEVLAEEIPPYDAGSFEQNKDTSGAFSPELIVLHEANMELVEKFKQVAAVVQSGDAQMQQIHTDVQKLEKATAALEQTLKDVKKEAAKNKGAAGSGAQGVQKSALDDALKKVDEKLKKHEETTTAMINAKVQNNPTVVTSGAERSIGSVREWTPALQYILQLANDRFDGDDSKRGHTTQYRMIKRFLTTTLRSMNVQLTAEETAEIMKLDSTEEEEEK